MEDTLERLLAAEERAQSLVREADTERERMVHAALTEIRAAERRFEARIPELRQSHMERAEQQAKQEIGEIKRRYEERHAAMRTLAEAREAQAVEDALAVLLDPTQ
jgi:vacuolar-type H+-ATPase subunit H